MTDCLATVWIILIKQCNKGSNQSLAVYLMQNMLLPFICCSNTSQILESPSYMYIILRIQTKRANSVELDEVAHYEPPHQDLHCLPFQQFSSPVLKRVHHLFVSNFWGLVRLKCTFVTL